MSTVLRARRDGRVGRLLLLLLAASVTFALLLPVIVIALTAFKPSAEINAFPPTLLPDQWTTANVQRIFSDLPFARLFGNSVIFAGGVTACALVFDSLAAYALARLDFRGRQLLLVAIVATLMIPFQATLIPVYQLVAQLGWVNTYAGLIVPRAADAFGFFGHRRHIQQAACLCRAHRPRLEARRTRGDGGAR